METPRQSKRGTDTKKYNCYRYAFGLDKIALNDIMDSVVRQYQIVISFNVEFVDDGEPEWIDDRSEPERWRERWSTGMAS